MTHGEAYVAEKESLALINGVWTKTLEIKNKKPQMNKQEALIYYNTKLYKHWLDELNKEAPGRNKLNAIHLKNRMFGCPQNAKLSKEILT